VLSFRLASNVISKMFTTDDALGELHAQNIALEIYRSNCRTAFDVNLSRTDNVTTPQLPVVAKFSTQQKISFVFVLGARC
jgi:hypothetical protein